MKIYPLFQTILLVFCATLFSQIKDVNPPNNLQTIIFIGNTPQAQLPIIKPGERLQLSFDDINGNERDYYYIIEHFNFDWTPSDLSKSEYLEGFDDVRINYYENSLNTLQMYSHYDLNIPNRDTRAITKTGNYLLKILDDRGTIMFTRKFIVYDDIASVSVAIKRARDLNYINTKQVVNFSVNSPSLLLINPNQNVKSLVLQNNNLNTAITNLKPQYTIGNELIYRYDQEASFWAGNEYLNFDNSDVRGATVNIRRVELEDLYINYLYTNIARKERPYTYYPDINGNFLVRNIRGQKESIDAEYVWVHFALQYYDDLKEGQEIHLYGNFNNFNFSENTRMVDRKSVV